ncbi:hypothetical protein ONE63_011460 [Megalurothrips usitatus]|uniref:Uncharacterized protein n=1 Tax=Megalurothrips usitatus TaxID=439358 RepID=A0AAV7X3C0_9NEOP|nr:hypothetical protein ONE63_011460 [Megalurothrips usitatus]
MPEHGDVKTRLWALRHDRCSLTMSRKEQDLPDLLHAFVIPGLQNSISLFNTARGSPFEAPLRDAALRIRAAGLSFQVLEKMSKDRSARRTSLRKSVEALSVQQLQAALIVLAAGLALAAAAFLAEVAPASSALLRSGPKYAAANKGYIIWLHMSKIMLPMACEELPASFRGRPRISEAYAYLGLHHSFKQSHLLNQSSATSIVAAQGTG